MPGALEGLRVIDLTHALAGPYATMMLTDLGADVVKVEPPSGDVTRNLGPDIPDDEVRAFGGYFQSINRGKRSVVLDLKTEEDVAILRDMVRDADVLIENFSLGVMDRLHLSYEELHKINPRLVYGCIRGYGDPRLGESPYARWPAMDITAQAQAGAMGITGLEDGTPVKIGPGVGDIFPGTLLTIGVLSAVINARVTGKGQLVDIAMYDAILSLSERIVYQHSYTGAVPAPEGNRHPFWSPFDVFDAKDGWIAIAAPTVPRWRALCEAMGKSWLADDQRYLSPSDRAARRTEVRDLVQEWTGSLTRSEIMDALGGIVSVGPINTIVDILNDPHVAARDMIVEVEQPGAGRTVSIAGAPIKMSETPSCVRGRAPLLDEHGAAVRDPGRRWL